MCSQARRRSPLSSSDRRRALTAGQPCHPAPGPCPLLPHAQLISFFRVRRLVFESLRARRISQVVAGSAQQALLQDVHRPGDHEDSDD